MWNDESGEGDLREPYLIVFAVVGSASACSVVVFACLFCVGRVLLSVLLLVADVALARSSRVLAKRIVSV